MASRPVAEKHVPSGGSSPQLHSFEVSVRGRAQGREVGGRWRATTTREALSLHPQEWQGAPLVIAVHSLDGAALDREELTLYLAEGEQLTLYEGEGLAEVSQLLGRLAIQVGELMRASRAAGSRRARPGPEHDRFFAPFLALRLKLEAEDDVKERHLAVAASELRTGVSDAIAAFAETRYPEGGADQRALLAELDEYMSPLFESLDRLDAAAIVARDASRSRRFAEWRRWRELLSESFVHAERAWMAAVPSLDEVPAVERVGQPTVNRAERRQHRGSRGGRRGG